MGEVRQRERSNEQQDMEVEKVVMLKMMVVNTFEEHYVSGYSVQKPYTPSHAEIITNILRSVLTLFV